MKDRIEGWTQADEDMTFGLNGCERCWMGDDLPPEAQRLIMGLRRELEKVLRECTPPKVPDSIQHAAFERIAEAHGGGLQKTSGPYWENLHLLCKCGHSRGGHFYHVAHCVEGEQEDCPCEEFALEEKL